MLVPIRTLTVSAFRASSWMCWWARDRTWASRSCDGRDWPETYRTSTEWTRESTCTSRCSLWDPRPTSRCLQRHATLRLPVRLPAMAVVFEYVLHRFSTWKQQTNRCVEQYLKPVDCAAVDKWGKLAKSVAKRVTDGAHGEHDMQLITASADEHVEQGDWRAIGLFGLVALTIERAHLVANLLLLVCSEQVGHLTSIQQIAQILQERLVLDLLSKSAHCK